VGDPEDGQMIVPVPGAIERFRPTEYGQTSESFGDRDPLRCAAEESVPYVVGL
jgi:hypothetical protein